MKKTAIFFSVIVSMFAEASLNCEVTDDKRIVATVTADRGFQGTEARSVTFYWSTKGAEWDKRIRELSLPANHSKVWDWRSFEPRSGDIHVTATINGMSIQDECDIPRR